VAEVSASEISRLAGVTRATVSNWRRRYDDFPRAVAGTDTRPLFDLGQVQSWLTEHGVRVPESPAAELRTLVRSRAPETVAEVLQALDHTDEGWQAPEISTANREFATGVAQAVVRTAGTDGVRVAFDILAERAMEGTPTTGVYGTPPEVADLMVRLSAVGAGARVLDPACGSGMLLLAAVEAGASQVCGQDIVPVQVARTRLMLSAEPSVTAEIRSGDSLLADAFDGRRFDAVLCNPPYGQRDWGSGELALDSRWDYGLPPRGEPELAWVQHAIAHLCPGADAVVLLPPAVAGRMGGRKIRANLVRTGALRAVIGLPPGAAPPWHVGLQIWIVRKPEPGAEAPNALLFVDTTAMAAVGAERTDWDSLGADVLERWRAFDAGEPERAEASGVAAVVRPVDVLDDDVDLTPARYVRSAMDSGAIADQLGTALDTLGAAARELAGTVGRIKGEFAEGGSTWRLVTVADLAAHGQLEWIRSQPGSSDKSETGDTRPVLTAPDVATGAAPSGTVQSIRPAAEIEVHAGDVLIPAVRSDRSGTRSAGVAGPEEAGALLGPHIHVLRLDGDQLDPWFVAGFLTGNDNIAATRTSTVRFDPSRLRLPVMPLAEQQRFGALFRQLFRLRITAGAAFGAADEISELLTTGLTAGVLTPVDPTTAG